MVTAGEIVTDDRWAGAAVSRRMRLKTGGFAPTPPSTNMIMYKHHPVPIWSCTNSTPNTNMIIHKYFTTMFLQTKLIFYMGQIPFVHANSKNFVYNDKKYISFCENVENYIVCFRPPSHECCTFHITKHILHYTGSHWLGLFCAIHLECSVRCFVLAPDPRSSPKTLIHDTSYVQHHFSYIFKKITWW